MRAGDVIGHEFMGIVEEVGREVKPRQKGRSRRGAVLHFVGAMLYCQHDLWSCCDNTNPNAELQDPLLGYATAGIYGYTHAFGGYAGAHAKYVRVPHANYGCFLVPDGLLNEQVLFFSDAASTGYIGADFCNLYPGDVVGGVGLAEWA